MGGGANKCSLAVTPEGSKYMQNCGDRVGLRISSKRLSEVSIGLVFTRKPENILFQSNGIVTYLSITKGRITAGPKVK